MGRPALDGRPSRRRALLRRGLHPHDPAEPPDQVLQHAPSGPGPQRLVGDGRLGWRSWWIVRARWRCSWFESILAARVMGSGECFSLPLLLILGTYTVTAGLWPDARHSCIYHADTLGDGSVVGTYCFPA